MTVANIATVNFAIRTLTRGKADGTNAKRIIIFPILGTFCIFV